MKFRSLWLACGAILFSPFLCAETGSADPWTVRFGIAHVRPNDDSGEVSGISNSRVGVDQSTGIGLAISYRFHDHLGVELLASSPMKHDLEGAGALDSLGRIGDVKHLPPTLSLQYYFVDRKAQFNPYIGIGINYTVFFDEQASTSLESALGGKTDVDLDNSVGLAGQAGFDWRLSEKWVVNAAVWYVDIDTTATLTTATARRKVDVEIDPFVYMIGVGYRF